MNFSGRRFANAKFSDYPFGRGADGSGLKYECFRSSPTGGFEHRNIPYSKSSEVQGKDHLNQERCSSTNKPFSSVGTGSWQTTLCKLFSYSALHSYIAGKSDRRARCLMVLRSKTLKMYEKRT